MQFSVFGKRFICDIPRKCEDGQLRARDIDSAVREKSSNRWNPAQCVIATCCDFACTVGQKFFGDTTEPETKRCLVLRRSLNLDDVPVADQSKEASNPGARPVNPSSCSSNGILSSPQEPFDTPMDIPTEDNAGKLAGVQVRGAGDTMDSFKPKPVEKEGDYSQ